MTKKTLKSVPMFRQNDWCFCEFKLQQIKEMTGDKVTQVSDGYFSHSGSDLTDRCYPLEMRYKLISEEVSHWSRKIHDLNNNSLNHPDINRALIEKWCDMCDNVDDNEKLQQQYNSLADFCRAIISKVQDARSVFVDDVRIFGR